MTTGTISHGTMRPKDFIPVFLDALTAEELLTYAPDDNPWCAALKDALAETLEDLEMAEARETEE